MSSPTLTVLFLMLICVGYLNAEDCQIGIITGKVVFSQTVQKSADPLTTKVEVVMFKDSSKIIKGIKATDLDKTEGRLTITAGGIGLSFAKIQLKSKKGEGLNYIVEVFA